MALCLDEVAAHQSEVTQLHFIVDDGTHCPSGTQWVIDPGYEQCVTP